jgi:hypothetical protein
MYHSGAAVSTMGMAVTASRPRPGGRRASTAARHDPPREECDGDASPCPWSDLLASELRQTVSDALLRRKSGGTLRHVDDIDDIVPSLANREQSTQSACPLFELRHPPLGRYRDRQPGI